MNKSINILLVEDSPDDVRLTEEALLDAGLNNTLFVVEDGEEAVLFLERTGKYADAADPDIVLLDLNLPKRSGHEVLAEMKANPRYAETPVVLLTVSQSEDDIAKALDTGMNYYMRKPVEPKRLLSVLEAICCEEDHGGKINNAVYFVLASNPQTPKRIMEKLARHANEAVKKHVAENPKIDPALLFEMSRDQSHEVRLGVANNQAATDEILWMLSKDESPDVRLGLAERTDIPIEILIRLSEDDNPYVASRANDTIEQVKNLAAGLTS
jgi:CheY-like chemotaxis protein